MTMLDDPVAGQPAPSPSPAAAPALATSDPVAGQAAPPEAIDPIAGQSAPLAVRAPVTPEEYRQRVSDPNTTYAVKTRTGFLWGASDTETPMTFGDLYGRFVPPDVQQRVQVFQNVATRSAQMQDPLASQKQFQADKLQHDLTQQYVREYDPTAFPEDEAQLRGQLTDLYKNNPASGGAVTALTQGVEGIAHNVGQVLPVDQAANLLQGIPESQWNKKRIIDELTSEIQGQVNPTTAAVARVAGNVVSPESLATGEIAGEVGGAARAAGATPLAERALVHGVQATGQSTALAGTENRLPTPQEIAANAAAGFVAGGASAAASRALPFAQKAAEASVAGDLPSYALNKAGDITSSSLASASALVAANAAAAKAQGRDYSAEDAKRDFAMGVTLEPVARAHAALTNEPLAPLATFADERAARKFAAETPNATYVPIQAPDGSTVHAVRPVPDGARTPERIQESAEQVALAERAFRRQTGDNSLTLTPVEDPGVGDFGRMLGDRLGLKVHWYQSNKPLAEGSPSATYLGNGHVAVDVGADNGARDPVADIPHEFIHDLRRTAPQIYQDIAQLAERVAPNRLAQARQDYIDRYRQVLGREISPNVADEEGVADFVKSMMTTPQKWDYLTRRQPTLADKFGAFVRDKLGVAPYSEPAAARVETAGSRIADLVPAEADVAAPPAGTKRPSPVTPPPINEAKGPISGTEEANSGTSGVPAGGEPQPIGSDRNPGAAPPSPKRWTADRIQAAIERAYEETTGDKGNSEDVILHPDQLDGLSAREKAKVSKYADEDQFTNRTADMSVGQAEVFSRNMLVRALGNSNRGHTDDAMAWARGHEDPAVQFMAWMHENRAGTQKQLVDLTSPEKVEEMLGKTFTINKEPFQLQIDDKGIVHLVDSDVEFAGADRIGDRHVPVDAGSVRDQLAAKPSATPAVASDELPFSLFKKRDEGGGDTQLSLAGEREGRATVGGTRPMFGDAQGKSPGVSDRVTSAPLPGVHPSFLEKFGVSPADVDAARAYSDGEPSAAFAYGSKRARAGLGMKAVEGMTRAEAADAHAGWKAAKAGMSDITRQAAENPAGLKPEDLAERKRIESRQVGETGHLFSLASKEELDKISPAARLARAARGAIQDVRDGLNLDPVPKLTRMGGGDEAASHAFARPAAKFIVRDLLARVFPTQYQDPAAMTRTWEALNADRLLGMYDEFKTRAAAKRAEASALAKEKTTVPGANAERVKTLSQSADEYQQRANAIDVKHSTAALESTWRQAMADPTIAGNIDRWNKIGAPLVDGLYNELKALDPDAPRPPRGRNSAGVSLVSTDHDLFDFGAGELGQGEADPKQPAGGTMKNAKVSKDKWDQAATGLGDYDTSPENVLGKIVGSRWNQVTKLRLFDQLQKSGGGIINDLPPAITEEGKRVAFRRLDITQPKTEENGFTRMVPKTMWVRPEIYREVRDVLNTDLAPPSSPVFRGLTRLQLLQIADAVTHTKNLHSVIAAALGGESAWRDLARKVPGLATADAVQEWTRTWREITSDSPKIRAELSSMAQAGNLRPDFPATGLQKITKMQDFLHAADTAGRVILNRRWENLVARGVVEESPAGRRNFIGQLGNYNRRLMNPMARIFKDLGLSPFVTAGTTFNRQGRRLITGDPGFTAATAGAGLRARAMNIGGVILAMGLLPGLVNSATTGNPLGRSGTPLGAIDTGLDDDQGGHRVFDYLQLMGMRRGLRSLGLDAIANGLLQGKDWNTIGGQAVNDITQSALHPWMGPGLGFAAAALTGRRLDTRGKMEAAVVPEGGLKQNEENLRAALASQNPFLYSVARAGVSGADEFAGGEGTGQGTAADLADVGKTLLKSPEGAFGLRTVRPGTDAAHDAAARLAASHYPDEGPAAANPKAAAVKKLSDALRSGDEGAADQLHQAIADGTITEKDVPRIIDRSSMSDLEWKVSHMSGKEAATVYAAGTDEEKAQMRDAVVTRVARDNTLSSQERGSLLQGIAGEEGVATSTAEAKMVSELADLRGQDHAEKTLKMRIQSLSRQIGQASAAGDGNGAQKLRQQRQSLVSASKGAHVHQGRMKRLGAIAGRVSKIRKQVARGSLTKQVGAGKIRQTLAAVH